MTQRAKKIIKYIRAKSLNQNEIKEEIVTKKSKTNKSNKTHQHLLTKKIEILKPEEFLDVHCKNQSSFLLCYISYVTKVKINFDFIPILFAESMK